MKKPFQLPWIFAAPLVILSASVIGMLIWAILWPAVYEDGKVTRVYEDLPHLIRLLEQYRSATGKLPTDEQGFDALIKRPEDASAQWTQGLQAVPWDPWGNRYHYRKSIRNGVEVPEVLSAGKDSLIGTEDDLSSLEP
jgi:general secretion pathway protein G